MSLQGALLGIGNPLLDISAAVSEELLTKYDLKAGNACLAEPKHVPLYKELVENYPVEYIAGGAAQNTIRAAQWMSQTPGLTGYIGCVGKDEFGTRLKEAAEKDGVTTHYLQDQTVPTGTCAVLLVNKERSLCANLAAAEKYQQSHYESQEIHQVVQKAQYFYATGFFLTHSPQVIRELGQHAANNNKHFALNLAAPFLIDFFWDALASVLPYADIVFSNESEAETLGKKLGWGSDLKEIALKLADFEKVNKNRTRMVIFTQGANQTIVVKDGKVQTFTPIPCPKEEIVDVNGAGDSFVGGFLSRFVQGKSVDESVAAGHYCAYECIRRPGCTFPAKPSFNFA
jgi:adenosine kinase